MMDSIKYENKFVYQLIKEIYNSQSLNSQVRQKIIYYTSLTKKYLYGLQFKAQNMDRMLDKMYKYISVQLNHNINNNVYILDLNLIDNFSGLVSMESYLLSSNNNNHKIFKSNEWIISSKDILINSLMGINTINKYGELGFMALLLIYMDDNDKEIFGEEIESLQIKCMKISANKINMMISRNNLVALKNLDILIKKFNPKDKLNKWLNLLKTLEYISNIESIIEYMKKPIQLVLFKEVHIKNNRYIKHYIYYSDYDKIIDNLNTKLYDLAPYVKDIYKIKTIKEWINYINKLLVLPSLYIITLFMLIDYNFAYVFLNLQLKQLNRIERFKIMNLKIYSKKLYLKTNGKYYEERIAFYNFNNNYIPTNEKVWIYNKNLDIIGYKMKNIYDKTISVMKYIDGNCMQKSIKPNKFNFSRYNM